ncbi:glycerophosphodiester phosphodiesterase family protein [Aquabacter cavernae]|uniref:glycerophosphodiester phosphodiesterase family protein n=1 Tax=Aquabacter cavernae TaxID=2496029 RepID=UPI000F8EF512|nr:glycerophosphodiester phosphodiesterase family protein [Aquabacter cavernae]
MRDLTLFTRQPVAHRGLHDAARGIVENSRSAVSAAVAGGFGVEIDVQLSADGKVVVFHDTSLDRLTQGRGAVNAQPAATLHGMTLLDTPDHILKLRDVLDIVAGRSPLLIEMKSAFDGDMRLADACVALLADYAGPFALMSFDPDLIAHVRHTAPSILRGIVAEGRYDEREWPDLSNRLRRSLPRLLHWPRTRFDFVAYRVRDLGDGTPRLMRRLGIPVFAWTVRTPEQRARGATLADQIIFESFVPGHPPE